MPYEDITGRIPQAVLDDVTTKQNEINTALAPYLYNLSVDERKRKYKMGPTRVSLGQNTLKVYDTLPVVVPAYVDVAASKDDFYGVSDLLPIKLRSDQLSEALDDTMMARGSEVLTKCVLPVYAALKAAKEQNVPGADTAFDLLNQYFDLPDQPDGGNP